MNLDYYQVIYSGGMCGVWFIWFINQHTDFPKFDKKYRKKHPTSLLPDLESTGGDWNTDDTKWNVNYHIFKEYATDLSASKRCIRTTNHGVCGLTNENLQNIDNYIFLYTDDLYKKLLLTIRWLAVQNESDYETLNNIVKSNLTAYRDNNLFLIGSRYDVLVPSKEIKELNKKYIYIDIGKILNKDQTEYSKLLTFIGSDALPNFEQLVNEYYSDVFSKLEQMILEFKF